MQKIGMKTGGKLNWIKVSISSCEMCWNVVWNLFKLLKLQFKVEHGATLNINLVLHIPTHT